MEKHGVSCSFMVILMGKHGVSCSFMVILMGKRWSCCNCWQNWLYTPWCTILSMNMGVSENGVSMKIYTMFIDLVDHDYHKWQFCLWTWACLNMGYTTGGKIYQMYIYTPNIFSANMGAYSDKYGIFFAKWLLEYDYTAGPGTGRRQFIHVFLTPKPPR